MRWLTMDPSVWMRQSLDVYNKTGLNDAGEPSWGAPTTVDARFSQKRVRVVHPDHEEWVNTLVAHVPAGTTIEVGDKVVFPDTTVSYVSGLKPVLDAQGTTLAWCVYFG